MTYSNKFRLVAVNVYKYLHDMHNYNVCTVARIIKISKSVLYNWISYNKITPPSNGDITSTLSKPKLGKKKLKGSPTICFYICGYVLKRKFFSVKLLIRNIKRKFSVSISKSYIYHILKKF
ncbi:MAG: hypothetical protein Hyperionvirus52_3 [Hyperionvirus sp.]|uniref:Uncharacterized protein n=1 Tax=Hyperionvirus sp. TaxID=2487770 RepID=A0A3G5ACM3_9VIRU|nr:MAG: hypothetical protein Hyperionvirus52_3 [Hyperionvirus sp.]